MLGSFSSSSIRSSKYFELYMRGRRRSEGQRESAGNGSDRLVHLGLGLLLSLAHRGQNQVLEQRRIGILERLGADLQLLEHLFAVDHRADQPAPGAGLEALVGELLLH